MRKIKTQINNSEHAIPIERASYASYFVGQNVIYQLVTIGLMIYWTDIVGISAIIAGLIMLISRFWDAVNDPILAGIINKTGKTRWGVYKPWTFVSAIILPAALIMIFTAPFGVGASTGSIAWAIISYVLFWMIYTITDVPIFSLSVTMEPDLKRRTKLLLLGRIASAVAGLFVSALWYYVIYTNKTLEMFIIMASALAAFSLVLMMPILIVKERNVIKDAPKITYRAMFKFVFTNKYLLKLMIAIFFSRLFFGAALIGSYFWTEHYIETTQEIVVLIAILVSLISLIFTIIIAKLLVRFGTRKTIFSIETIGIMFAIVGFVATLYTKNAWTFFVLNIGGNLILLTPSIVNKGKLTADCIEYGHFQTGQRNETTGFAVQTFMVKLMSGISSFISGALISAVGYDSVRASKKIAQVDGVMDRMFWMFFIVFCIIYVINIIVYCLLYDLRSKDVHIMSASNRGIITKKQAEDELKKPFKERSIHNLTDPVILPPSKS